VKQKCCKCGSSFTRRAANTRQVRCRACQDEREATQKAAAGDQHIYYRRERVTSSALPNREWTVIVDPAETGALAAGMMLSKHEVTAGLLFSTFTVGTWLCSRDGRLFAVANEENHHQALQEICYGCANNLD
jgi:hypothetical protein